MEKLIPFEKLSKKEQRKRNAARRAGWCGLNPVTRKPENPKAYNRRKARQWSDDSMTVPFAMPVKSAAFYLSVIFPAQYSFARRQQRLFEVRELVAADCGGSKYANREGNFRLHDGFSACGHRLYDIMIAERILYLRMPSVRDGALEFDSRAVRDGTWPLYQDLRS